MHESTTTSEITFERHFSVEELSTLLGMSDDFIRRLFLHEPGVVIRARQLLRHGLAHPDMETAADLLVSLVEARGFLFWIEPTWVDTGGTWAAKAVDALFSHLPLTRPPTLTPASGTPGTSRMKRTRTAPTASVHRRDRR